METKYIVGHAGWSPDYKSTPEVDTAPEQWRSQCLVARIQRDQWRDIAKDALASLRCTQRPETYPEDHWSRRAQTLLDSDPYPVNLAESPL